VTVDRRLVMVRANHALQVIAQLAALPDGLAALPGGRCRRPLATGVHDHLIEDETRHRRFHGDAFRGAGCRSREPLS
jgi:hypothetical protein